jgi:hypothetical protein
MGYLAFMDSGSTENYKLGSDPNKNRQFKALERCYLYLQNFFRDRPVNRQ